MTVIVIVIIAVTVSLMIVAVVAVSVIRMLLSLRSKHGSMSLLFMMDVQRFGLRVSTKGSGLIPSVWVAAQHPLSPRLWKTPEPRIPSTIPYDGSLRTAIWKPLTPKTVE